MLAYSLANELHALDELVRRQVEDTEPILASTECIYVIGSGDSFAAALAVEALSGGRAIALDPYDVARSGILEKGLSRGCVLLALSVGGRTRAVVESARVYREIGGRVYAVTANLESPLARWADYIVELVYGGLAEGIGAARHVVMLAALAKAVSGEKPQIVGRSRGNCSWFRRAEIFVGSLESFSSALYASLKLYEVYGSSVRFERFEQFLHAPIYSVHSVTLFEPVDNEAASRIKLAAQAMKETGMEVHVVEAVSSNGWSNALSQAYTVLGCLYEAVVSDGVSEPAYRKHRGLKKFTELIYYV